MNLLVLRRHQLYHVRKGVAWSFQHHHGEFKRRKTLLIRQILIHHHEHVELPIRSTQQLPVAQTCLPLARPRLVRPRHDIDCRVEVRFEKTVYGLVG